MEREKIYLKNGHTDMRRGIDGLAGVVKEEMGLKVCDEKAMFIFCGRKKDRYKILYWERDGFTLLYKRIEKGRLKWPNELEAVLQLTSQQYRWLTEGLSISQPRAIQEIESVNII